MELQNYFTPEKLPIIFFLLFCLGVYILCIIYKILFCEKEIDNPNFLFFKDLTLITAKNIPEKIKIKEIPTFEK